MLRTEILSLNTRGSKPKRANANSTVEGCCPAQYFYKDNYSALACLALFQCSATIAVQRSALAKYGEFIARLTSADDEYKRNVETIENV